MANQQNQSIAQANGANQKQEPEGQPPQPPQAPKKFEFTRSQLLGIPIILLIPILALFNLFGESAAEVVLEADDLRVTVEYPTKFRYKQIDPMEIYVQNFTASTMPTVTVSIDAAYLLSFSNVSFTPSVDEVTAEAYRVYLTDVKPAEVRLVTVELQAEHYWQHAGTVAVQAPDGNPLVTEVSTFIFP